MSDFTTEELKTLFWALTLARTHPDLVIGHDRGAAGGASNVLTGLAPLRQRVESMIVQAVKA